MSTMRERIAKAIARNSDCGELMWMDHLGSADAVLSELENPTPEMVIGGWNETHAARKLTTAEFRTAFIAAIKAAKE